MLEDKEQWWQRERFWFTKAVQTILSQNKSDVEKAKEITEMAYKLK